VRPLDHLMATASGLRGRTLEIENEHDDENDLGGDFEDVECRNPDRLTYSRQAVPACFRGAGDEEVRRDALPTSNEEAKRGRFAYSDLCRDVVFGQSAVDQAPDFTSVGVL
jgi:hypothetical protein